MSEVAEKPHLFARTGRPTAEDYAEAIRALQDAALQLEPDGRDCTVCGDGGHQGFECDGHNPLILARVGYARITHQWPGRMGQTEITDPREYRYYHCGFIPETDASCGGLQETHQIANGECWTCREFGLPFAA